MARNSLLFSLCIASAALVGCGDDDPAPPDGVECGEVISAGDDGASMSQALAQAGSGDCVVASGSLYEGTFVVNAGVKLVAAKGASPQIKGQGDKTAIEVKADPGSLVQGFTVQNGGIGVLVSGSQGTVKDVSVMGASRSAFAAYRDKSLGGPDTMPAEGVVISNVDLHASGMGLWASNVRITLEGGQISDNAGDNLTSGYGLVAIDGTQLSATATTIKGNSYGVILDGGGGTTAQLTSLKVLSNSERGIWAQKLTGTAAAPALSVEGNDTLIDGNSLTGFGALESKGIIIIGGKISNTQKKPVVTSLGGTAEVGDGVGLFDNTGDVKLDGVTLEANQRSQALIDQGAKGIIIIGGKITATGDQLKVVVQNTTEDVEVPMGALSEGGPMLAVSASPAALSSVVQ